MGITPMTFKGIIAKVASLAAKESVKKGTLAVETSIDAIVKKNSIPSSSHCGKFLKQAAKTEAKCAGKKAVLLQHAGGGVMENGTLFSGRYYFKDGRAFSYTTTPIFDNTGSKIAKQVITRTEFPNGIVKATTSKIPVAPLSGGTSIDFEKSYFNTDLLEPTTDVTVKMKGLFEPNTQIFRWIPNGVNATATENFTSAPIY